MAGNSSSMASSPTRAEALTFQSSVAGAVIPWLRGMHRVPGNLVWYGDFAAIAHQQQQGGKGGGGSTSTSYTYTSSLVMIAAHGPVQDIPQVWKGKSKTSRSALGLSLLSGAIGQAAWSGLAGKGVENIGYSGLAGVAVAAYDLGDSSSVENHSFEVRHASAYGTVASSPDVDPVPAVRELLTDTHRGAGMPDELLGDWTSWSQSCVANGLLMSPLLLTQAPAHEAFALVTELTNSAIVWSEGKIKVRSYFDQEVTAHGVTYTPDTVPVYQLNDSCYISSDDEAPVRVSLKTNDDRFNSVTVEYKDRSNGYNVATVTAKDLTDISANGVRAMSNVTAHWICDAQVARLVAEIKKQRSLLVVGEYTIRLPWHYALIECMDLLTLTDSVLEMLDVPVRVKTIVEESDEELLITCEDYPAGVASAPRYAAQVPAGFAQDALVAPGTATDAMFFEAPAALAAGGTGLEVWAAVRSAGAQWGGCTVWVSLDQVNYRAIGKVSAGARNGTLSAPISGGNLTLQGVGGQLVGASAEDAAALATLCYIGGAQPEYLAYQTASLIGSGAYTLGGLVRGAYGSNALAHAAGDPFVRVDDAIVKSGGLDVSYIGKRIYFKLTSWNIFGTSEQSLAEVAAMPYDVSGVFAMASPGTAGRGLTLKASAQTIKQDAGGDRLPAAITLSAELKGSLQGAPSWSVVTGAATLSGTGLQRTIDTSTVTGPARIRIELIDPLGTYSDEVTLNVLTNGENAPKFARPALYQWAPLQPAAPTGQATYTWASGALSAYTGGNNWQVGMPANPGTGGAKLWQASKQVQAEALETATVVAYGGADVTVSSVAANGVGQQTAEAAIYCWALNLAALPSLVGTSTYTWASSSLSDAPSGWSLQPGSAATPGQTLYKASVRVSDASTEPTTTVNWTLSSTNAIGYAGTVGAPGGPGASSRIAYAKITGVTIGAGQVQTDGSASLPPVNSWGRGETWATSVPALSATESIMLTNGMYDPSTDKVTWGSPYLATWKVGKLSAITADLGDITAGSINIGNGKFTVSGTGDAVMRSLQVVRDSDGKVILNAAAALPIDHSVVAPAAGWLNSNVQVGGPKLVNSANCTITGSTVEKTSGVGGWNAGFYSKDSYSGGAYVSFVAGSAGSYGVGLNDSPSESSSYEDIMFWLYFESDGGPLYRFVNGVGVATGYNGSIGDVLAVSYDGVAARWYKNGTEIAYYQSNYSGPLFVDGTFNTPGGKVTNVQFGPMTNNLWGSIGNRPSAAGSSLMINYGTDLAYVNANDPATSSIIADTTASDGFAMRVCGGWGGGTHLNGTGANVARGLVQGKKYRVFARGKRVGNPTNGTFGVYGEGAVFHLGFGGMGDHFSTPSWQVAYLGTLQPNWSSTDSIYTYFGSDNAWGNGDANNYFAFDWLYFQPVNVEEDATKGATWGTNVANVPINLAQLTGSEGIKNELLSEAIQAAAATANWGTVSGKPAFGSLALANSVGWSSIDSRPAFTAFATLDKLTGDNASTYIEAAAIGLAQIKTATITNLAALATYTGTLVVGQNADGIGNGFIRMGKAGYASGDGLYIGGHGGELSFDLGNDADYVRWKPSTGWVEKRSNLVLSLNTSELSLQAPYGSSYPWDGGYLLTKTISVSSGGSGNYAYAWSVIITSADNGGTIAIHSGAESQTIGLRGYLPMAGGGASAVIRCVVTDTSTFKTASASFNAVLSSVD